MSRAEKVAKAQQLREGGAKLREIAETMGVAIQTAQAWLSDPDLSKQRERRARYSRPCVDCGAATDGSGGFANQRERCNPCASARRHEQRHWTRESIIAWIRAFHAQYGFAPPATVQNGRRSPGVSQTAREFGTDGWRKALRAAGFEPYNDAPGSGHKLGADHPLMLETARLYRQGFTQAEIAEMHGVSSCAISQRLRRLGITGRSPLESRRLRLARVERQAVAA